MFTLGQGERGSPIHGGPEQEATGHNSTVITLKEAGTRRRVPRQRLDIMRRPGPYVWEHRTVLMNLALTLFTAFSLPQECSPHS